MTDDARPTDTAPAPAPPDGPSELHHPGDVAAEPHGPADHGEEHGHDDHAHAGETLGPVDVQAWGALVGGIGLGLIVAICVAISVSA